MPPHIVHIYKRKGDRAVCNNHRGISVQGLEESRMMGLPDGRKSFKIGLAILIQYWRVTDTQHPASQLATLP